MIVVLDYYTCNKDVLILFFPIIFILTIGIIFIKILAFTEYYASVNVPVPIYYFFGDKRAVRSLAQQSLLAFKETFSLAEQIPSYISLNEIPAKAFLIVRQVLQAISRVIESGKETRETMLREGGILVDKVSEDFVVPAMIRASRPTLSVDRI